MSKSDGKDYPQYQSGLLANFQIDGTKTPVTYSETVIDDHAVNVIAKANGQIYTKGVRRIDADGKTMTIDVVPIDQSGKETPIKLVFKRVGQSQVLCVFAITSRQVLSSHSSVMSSAKKGTR